jgi:hypothetical protein
VSDPGSPPDAAALDLPVIDQLVHDLASHVDRHGKADADIAAPGVSVWTGAPSAKGIGAPARTGETMPVVSVSSA